MRPLFLLTLASALFSCAPVEDEAPRQPVNPATPPVRAEHYPGNTTALTADGQLPIQSPGRHALRIGKATVAGVSLTFLAFDSREHTLALVDQDGIGSRYQTAAQATRSAGALAGINGGFFTPEGQPLGIIYHNGNKKGAINTASSLGSGVLYVDKKLAKPVLARRESFQKWLQNPAFDPREVLQTGPFLIENGKAVSGLSNKEGRIRSLLLWDGENHFALAQCEAISLRNLAGALARQPLDGFRVRVALNLDGGRSADLHVTSRVPGGPLNLRRWWNKPVRNYVVLKKQ